MQRPSPLEAPITTVRDISALSCNEPLQAQRIGHPVDTRVGRIAYLSTVGI
jgi:hypothetical protein